MKKKLRPLNLLLITALFLGACNLPSGTTGEDTVGTAAAQTLAAVLSATPLSGAVTPSFTPLSQPATLTPIPTNANTNTPVPTPTSNCNLMQFITDVTIPDGTIMAPSQAFTKTWRIKNVGTCTWTPSYAIVFSSGNSMNGPATQALTANVNPGQSVDISVNLTAPATPGDYTAYWKLRDGSGVLFNQFYVQIKVQNSVTPTYTLPPAIVFAVTGVTFNVTGTCPNFSYTVNVTTNGAGTVNLHRIFSDGGTDTLPRTLTFASAGTQSFTEPVYFGAAGSSSWTDIYIDSPNHQQFGRATFTCP
jgi:hypothetical protein